MMLTLAVLLLHLACCTVQTACGSGDEAEAGDVAKLNSPRDDIRQAMASQVSSGRAIESPLIGPGAAALGST